MTSKINRGYQCVKFDVLSKILKKLSRQHLIKLLMFREVWPNEMKIKRGHLLPKRYQCFKFDIYISCKEFMRYWSENFVYWPRDAKQYVLFIFATIFKSSTTVLEKLRTLVISVVYPLYSQPASISRSSLGSILWLFCT